MSLTGSDFAERIKKKYSFEVDEPSKQQDLGDFKRFIDYVSQNNNPDLWQWVGNQENVIKARAEMETLFNNYLFEVMKPQFVEFCKNASSDVIKNYVDVSIATSKEYVSPTVQFEEERKQLQDLIKSQSEMIENLKLQKEVIKI